MDENGVYKHMEFSEETCFKGIHLLHVGIGAIIGFVFLFICLIVVYTFFETKSIDNDPEAKTDNSDNVQLIIFKIVLIVLFDFF